MREGGERWVYVYIKVVVLHWKRRLRKRDGGYIWMLLTFIHLIWWC